jgi:sigma-B regulation protein RsbU (phosphoserine phosphatase)
MRLTIRTKLVLAIGIPLLATYLLMAWGEYRLGHREALANMEAHLAEVAARQAAELDGVLSTAATLAATAASFANRASELAPQQIRDLMENSLRSNPKVFGMCVAVEPRKAGQAKSADYCCRDSRAGLRYVNIAAELPDYTKSDWYRPARTATRPFWTEPYFDTGVGERLMCTYVVPLRRDGQFRGVVTVDILSDDLFVELSQSRFGAGYCMLISKRGTFISHPHTSLVLRESIFTLARRHAIGELAEAGREMVAGKTGVRRIRDFVTGVPKWMVYTPVDTAGWSLAAIIPEREVLAPVDARVLRGLDILGAGLVTTLGIVVLVAGRVTRPLGRLAAAAEAVGHGNLTARVSGIQGQDEVAQLARRFNSMVADLKSNVDARIREESSRRMVEGELTAARRIQASLLPAMLPDDRQRDFQLDAVNAPALFVAGDFYDFFFLDEQRLALVMADVSGKGVPAAMYMAVARTRLRDFAASDKTPAQVLAEVNRCLARENDQGMFVSIFFASYDVTSGELIYANAGHNPPYVVRSTGAIESLQPTGPLVAPFPDAQFLDASCRLAPGDLLVLFTDGVTESGVRGGSLFGEERLERLLRAEAAAPVTEICKSVVRAATNFSAGELADDVTVLALRRTVPVPPAAPLANVPAAAADAATAASD